MKKPVRVILLGAGRAGSFHSTTLRVSPAFEAVAVVDQDADRARTLAASLGCAWKTDPTEAFDTLDADAVIVATTTHTHTRFAQEALSRRYHVFCEKPLGELDDVRDCYRLARDADRALMVAFQRRFDPEFNALRTRIGEATPQLVKLTSRDSPIPSEAYLKTSGGIVKDCMVHDIDIANWVMGGSETHRVPVRVSAVGYAHHPDLKAWGEFEGVVVTMQYENGSLAVIDVSRTCNYGYDQRVEAFGSFGMLQLDNRRESAVIAHTGEGVVSAKPLYSFPQRYPDAYRLELEHFAAVVQGDAACRILESQVIATEHICEAIERAIETGASQPVTQEP
ncbi:MAG: Gfo/Idh/MocA family oxidoreductase [Candidatus Poribacteria bacterium]|nr:Gfo/Idh/MocA family oxidoreductase [Candidatus Poribacteria bacterium]